MAIQLVEGLIDELIAHLTSDMPAILDAIDTQYGDGVTLLDPTYSKADPELPEGSEVFDTTIFVIAAESDLGMWRQTTVLAEHDVVLWLVTSDIAPEDLRKRAYRYALAIFRTLVAGHFDSSITWNMIGTPNVDFGVILTEGDVASVDMRFLARFTKQEEA